MTKNKSTTIMLLDAESLRHLKKCRLYYLFIILFVVNPIAIGQEWMQMGGDINGEAIDDHGGASVSLSSDGLTIAIGSPFEDGSDLNTGSVRVFTYSGTEWIAKGNPITGVVTDRNFGISTSISTDGNRIAVCSSYSTATSANEEIKVYQWNGSEWEQLGNTLFWNSISIYYGAVKLSGNGETIAVGDMGNSTNGDNAGQVRIYSLVENTWQLRGSPVNGTIDSFTGSVLDLSLDGDTFATNLSSAVQVYSWNGSDWSQKGSLFNTYSYRTVSLSSNGNVVVLSGPNLNGASDFKGATSVYEWNGSTWTSKGSLIEGAPQSELGFSSSLSDNNQVLALGGPGANGGLGEVRTFMYAGNNWTQIGNTIEGETG
ncbi:MAG: hypothetical protein OQJ79_01265, partial [Altibacter sp.]|nr:hypothetical protein [Altibacter sp.]